MHRKEDGDDLLPLLNVIFVQEQDQCLLIVHVSPTNRHRNLEDRSLALFALHGQGTTFMVFDDTFGDA